MGLLSVPVSIPVNWNITAGESHYNDCRPIPLMVTACIDAYCMITIVIKHNNQAPLCDKLSQMIMISYVDTSPYSARLSVSGQAPAADYY